LSCVEEADRVHFVNFKPHSPTSGNHVTTYNLDKTRRLLGQATHDFCKRNNISSCWSDIAPAAPVTPTLPSGPGYKQHARRSGLMPQRLFFTFAGRKQLAV
jgi:hypothetical protein